MIEESQCADYFERMYRANIDPWHYSTSQYELSKYAKALQTLPYPTYENALELGCSIGVMSELLAARCRHLLALDCSKAALAQARQRCDSTTNISFEHAVLPQDFPSEKFDLVTFCEVGYYLSKRDLHLVLDNIAEALKETGHLLMVHWRGNVDDGPLNANQVHQLVRNDVRFKLIADVVHPKYLMELFQSQQADVF